MISHDHLLAFPGWEHASGYRLCLSWASRVPTVGQIIALHQAESSALICCAPSFWGWEFRDQRLWGKEGSAREPPSLSWRQFQMRWGIKVSEHSEYIPLPVSSQFSLTIFSSSTEKEMANSLTLTSLQRSWSDRSLWYSALFLHPAQDVTKPCPPPPSAHHHEEIYKQCDYFAPAAGPPEHHCHLLKPISITAKSLWALPLDPACGMVSPEV